MTRCSKCGAGSFETVEIEPKGSTYKLIAVQCRSCRAPFGVTDFWNVGTLLKNQEKDIADLKSAVQRLRFDVQQLVQALRR